MAQAGGRRGFSGDVFRHGRCFEIRVGPDGGQVGPSSKTTMKITIYYWVDKAEVKLPVRATLTGVASVDPSGQDQTTPTTETFTAGGANTTGDVAFKSAGPWGTRG